MLAYDYRSDNIMHPEFVFQHLHPDTTVVWFRINEDELLPTRTDPTEPFMLNFSIHWALYRPQVKVPRDSGTFIHAFEKTTSGHAWCAGYFYIVLPDTGKFRIELKTVDAQRKSAVVSRKQIERSASASNFLFVYNDSKTPVFNNAKTNSRLNVISPDSTVPYIYTFNPPYKHPKPPHEDVTKEKKIDANESFIVTDTGFILRDSTICVVCKNMALKQGCKVLAHYRDDYPRIRHAHQLVPSLRYITTNQEYASLCSASNKKTAVDDFWIARAGSAERAKILLQEYYHRVEEANKAFSELCEGYLSDRGMVHIIMGYPSRIHHLVDKEIWIYGDERAMQTITFTFDRVPQPPFSDQYRLRRGPLYKFTWFKAVDVWRSGRAFTY